MSTDYEYDKYLKALAKIKRLKAKQKSLQSRLDKITEMLGYYASNGNDMARVFLDKIAELK